MVDWKKDIKLSDLLARDREAADAAEEATPLAEQPDSELTDVEPEEAEATEATPFWKREIGFRRQKGESETDPDFDLRADESEKRPFFKRDLSFSRTKGDAAQETDVESSADEPEETTPFWRRELRFGRAKDDAVSAPGDAEEDTDFAAAATESEEGKPFWKRDLSFGRRKDEAPDTSSDHEETSWEDADPVAVAPEAPAEPEQPAHVEPEPVVASGFEADPVEKAPFWKRELSFGRATDDAVPAQGDAEEDTDFAAADTESEETKPFWKRDLSFGRRKDDTTDTSSDSEETSWEDADPVAVAPESPVPVEPEQLAHVEPDPVVASVSEADPVDEETPFWRRELSFGRTKDEAATDSDPEELANAADEQPFWKREIKFGRRREDEFRADPTEPEPLHEEAEPVAAAAFPPDPEDKKPFWKRDFKFGRTKEESEGDAGLDAEHETKEKKPFFKRGFSFRRTKDPDFDAPEKRPFFKRELSFRRGKGTGRDGTARSAKAGRTKQLVGLKVGASQIAAAQVVNNGSPVLVQLARQSIEQGIVVGGELRDPDALAEVLRDFFAKHKLPGRNVRLGIGNNRIGVRSFEISGVHDPKQLENAIRFRAQEALPIPLDEAVLDYHVIDEATSPTGIRTYRVLLVVAYRELIDRYVAACRGAGLRLVGIDLEAFALLRALSPPPSEGFPEDTALVAISIGHDRSTFAVSNGTVCEFTRVLDWGGSSLNTAIARALDMTPSQAEPVKRTLSLSEGEEGASTQENEHTIRAEEAVRLELQTFARELVSSLHFYQNQPGSLAIGTITLTGGTAHLPGLAAELQRLIGVKVRVGDPLRRVKTGKRVEAPEQVGSMAVAIGLGIED